MSVFLSLTTDGPEATRMLGEALAANLRAGDVLALSGELGAGKTCLVQGIGRGLGVGANITSPTFVLVKQHEGGRLPLVHVDVYRLDQLSDVEGLGDDVLGPSVVTVIEWGDTVDALLPPTRLLVDLELGDGEDQRAITIRGSSHWELVVPALMRAADETSGITVVAAGSATAESREELG